MKQWMHTRPIRVFGMLLALSLVLTACDPQSLLQLLDAKPVAQEAPAADAGDDAQADEAADEADGDGAAKDDRRGARDRKAKRDRGADGDRKVKRNRDAAGGEEEATERRSPKRKQTTRKKAEQASTPTRRSGGGGGGSATLSGVEQKIHELLNQTRRNAGLKPLTASGDVAKGARSWSCQMARSGNFRHADLSSAGVNGENIAWGQQGAAAVHKAWMNSSGHRSNRMNSRWTEYGVGVCEDSDGRPYYTERFR